MKKELIVLIGLLFIWGFLILIKSYHPTKLGAVLIEVPQYVQDLTQDECFPLPSPGVRYCRHPLKGNILQNNQWYRTGITANGSTTQLIVINLGGIISTTTANLMSISF